MESCQYSQYGTSFPSLGQCNSSSFLASPNFFSILILSRCLIDWLRITFLSLSRSLLPRKKSKKPTQQINDKIACINIFRESLSCNSVVNFGDSGESRGSKSANRTNKAIWMEMTTTTAETRRVSPSCKHGCSFGEKQLFCHRKQFSRKVTHGLVCEADFELGKRSTAPFIITIRYFFYVNVRTPNPYACTPCGLVGPITLLTGSQKTRAGGLISGILSFFRLFLA